ncbi:MAG: hypothetical protein VX430_09080 [Pseudomonadota bacterium]|nr:hypothetical protein [Pseudomonadota bacterium]
MRSLEIVGGGEALVASDEHHQRRHERRRTIDDVLTAQRIACQGGNETLAKMLEAALVAGVETIQNERRNPVHRIRLTAVAMNYFDQAFKPSVAE